MSEENEQLIREGYAALNRRDAEWLRAHSSPELEFRSRFSGLSGRTYRGEHAFEQWAADIDESWESVDQQPERMFELDSERTAVELRFKARGRGSGLEVEQRLAVIFTIRDQEVVRLVAFDSLDEALADAG